MAKLKNILIIVFVIGLASCDKISIGHKTHALGEITLGKMTISSISSTKADLSIGTISYADSLSGVFLNTEYAEEMLDGQLLTKASAISTETLGTFFVDAFLDDELLEMPAASEEDRSNLHFIERAPVIKSSGKWAFQDVYRWRYGIHHHFWGYTPSVDLSVDQENPSHAQFSYLSDAEHDLILSYTDRYYGKSEEPVSTRDNNLKLEFYHALTALHASADGIHFKIKTGQYGGGSDYFGTLSTRALLEDAPAGRASVLGVSARNLYSKGTCNLTEGKDFKWSDQDVVWNDDTFASGELRFLIPQSRDHSYICITVRDNQRQLTRPYVFESETLLGSGEWEAGKKYGYNISGTFILPQLPNGQSGIDADFSGKLFQTLSLIDNVATKYIKRIKLTWDGLPGGNPGNGTFVFLSIEPDGTIPSEERYMSGANIPNTSLGNIGFILDHKQKSVIKGEIDLSGTSEFTQGKGSCEIEIPEGVTNISICASYIGSNNSGTCEWKLRNLTMDVVEWR